MTKAYDASTSEVTIALRNQFPVKTIDGVTVYANFAAMTPDMLRRILEEGALRVLNDGIGSAQLTDAEKRAKIEKRLDAWARGEWTIKERAQSIWTVMRECFVAEMLEKQTTTEKAVEASIKATIAAVFGEKEKATFENYLKAVATLKAKADGEKRSVDDIRIALEEKYGEMAQARIAAQEAVPTVKIDVSMIDI